MRLLYRHADPQAAPLFLTNISQFSPDVVDQMSNRLASPEPTPERQSTLDAHIRSRIQAELVQLRKEEENVRQQIESALEKENLDRERAMAQDADESGGVKSSAALLGDLEEIQSKIDRFKSRKNLADFPALKEHQQAVIACYKYVSYSAGVMVYL